MKKVLYFLHSKWSLLSALLSLRLWSFEDFLWKNFPRQWQCELDLPNRDSIIFFPYIVSLNARTIKDPINIIAYGMGPSKFIELLRQANPKWHQFLGSSYFLHGSLRYNWHASIAIKLDINECAKERHHIRLFGLETTRGEKITLCAAHRDKPYHTEQETPLSWDETRDLVATDLAASRMGILCGLSKQVADSNWRNAKGDGKILIIKCKP